MTEPLHRSRALPVGGRKDAECFAWLVRQSTKVGLIRDQP
jgi:hypothetical protein